MYRMTIAFRIARPRREVIAWWTGFPDDYRAEDPREQPYRIRVLERGSDRLELATYFRVLGITAVIHETLHLVPDGNFSIDVHFPLGLEQRDDFTFVDENGATKVSIEFALRACNLLGVFFAPLYWFCYARPIYPRTFRTAGELCERDAPRLGVTGTGSPP